MIVLDIPEDKTEKVEDSPAVVQTPEVETVVEDDKPQKSPDVSQCWRILAKFSFL